MSDYVKTMLHDAPNDVEGKASTPAASHLFKVNSEDPKLSPKEEKEIFMHLVMQGLYLSQRGHPDICMAILFLCGWLNHPDWDNYKKLAHVI